MTVSGIEYPVKRVPESGQCIEVAPGVKWLRMPLPISLDHINLYMIDCEDGWLIVDTGMKTDAIKECWETIFASELEDKPVKAVLVTHMHPDHIGLAGWLCERYRVPLYISQLEYLQARCISTMPAKEMSWTAEEFFHQAGQDNEYIEYFRSRIGGFGRIVSTMPGGFQRLEEGQSLMLGKNRWRVLIGTGHSPEHVCLYCEALSVLISGDQIIPTISSNVSVLPIEPNANPLKGWIGSLHRFLELPDDTLVLPAHSKPFTGLHFRLRELIVHHEDHMLALEEACSEPKSATDLLPVLFKRKFDISLTGMALGECIAHLHLLMDRKRVERILGEDGVHRFVSIDQTLNERIRAGDHHFVDDEPIMI